MANDKDKNKDKEKKERKDKHEKALKKVSKHSEKYGITPDGRDHFKAYITMTDQEREDYLKEVGEWVDPTILPEEE